MNKRILILEDEKEIAQIYAKRLKEAGYETQLAFDGLEGLAKLKNFAPDLILLDLNMPKMGGLEFYQHICDSNGTPICPVLVLTGRADLEALFKDFHVEGFIIKPFTTAVLLKEVDIIFNKSLWAKTDGSAKKVVLIEDDYQSSQEILAVFRNAGYKIDLVTSGVSGIEKVINDSPDLVLVKLGLKDISGDLVILRLQQIAKVRKTSAILYLKRNFEHNKEVLDKIAVKTGVKRMFEYDAPAELLEEAGKVFRELEQRRY